MIIPAVLTLVAQQGDSLSSAYSEKWDGASGQGAVMDAMASNDLIFVVLGVTLIIWFTLLFFLVRLDRKVSALEKEVEEKINNEHLHEA